MLVFNPSAQFVLAASLEGERIRTALADLNGVIQVERVHEVAGDPAKALIHFLHALIKEVKESPERLAAIGVGVPGITHTAEGTVSHAPALGWREAVPLRDMLEREFQVPVLVENDVNLMVLGEHAQGAGLGVGNLALMHVGGGIGAGILIDGVLFRGPRDAAGEVGYLPLGPVVTRSPADFGLFERRYSARGVHDRMTQAGLAPNPELAEHPVATLRTLHHMQIPWAQALYEDTLCQWSYALAAIVCILNPERILLAGDAVECGDDGLALVQTTLASLVPVPPDVRFATLGSRAVLAGAVTSALQVAIGDGNATESLRA
jgi:predicted NBD/HSP70 family sugar kinase